MSKRNLPGFSADVSLYKTSGHYQTGRRAVNSSTQLISSIYPAMISTGSLNCGNCVGGECAELHCFENWTHGEGGGGGPYGGGGGGGGGGGRPSRRNCRDNSGKTHRHGTTMTTTRVFPPGGVENTYVSVEKCVNGNWNVVD